MCARREFRVIRDPRVEIPFGRLTIVLRQPVQRARSPDPQARGPQSQWTEAWPTQPAITYYTLIFFGDSDTDCTLL